MSNTLRSEKRWSMPRRALATGVLLLAGVEGLGACGTVVLPTDARPAASRPTPGPAAASAPGEATAPSSSMVVAELDSDTRAQFDTAASKVVLAAIAKYKKAAKSGSECQSEDTPKDNCQTSLQGTGLLYTHETRSRAADGTKYGVMKRVGVAERLGANGLVLTMTADVDRFLVDHGKRVEGADYLPDERVTIEIVRQGATTFTDVTPKALRRVARGDKTVFQAASVATDTYVDIARTVDGNIGIATADLPLETMPDGALADTALQQLATARDIVG